MGSNGNKLKELLSTGVTELNLNDYGRFDELKESVDKLKAKEYFEKLESRNIPPFKVNIRVYNLLKNFIISGKINVKIDEKK